jgi:hypothetical protein
MLASLTSEVPIRVDNRCNLYQAKLSLMSALRDMERKGHQVVGAKVLYSTVEKEDQIRNDGGKASAGSNPL